MKDSRPPEVRALDDAGAEFSRLTRCALDELEAMAVEREEIERLQKVASEARLACTSLVLEAGLAFIAERKARPDKSAAH